MDQSDMDDAVVELLCALFEERWGVKPDPGQRAVMRGAAVTARVRIERLGPTPPRPEGSAPLF